MPANPATSASKAPGATPAAADPAASRPRKPGRIRRFFRGLDEGMQLVDVLVAVGRAGGLAVRGIFHVFKIFD